MSSKQCEATFDDLRGHQRAALCYIKCAVAETAPNFISKEYYYEVSIL